MPLRTRIFIMVGAGVLVVAMISVFIILKTKKKPVETPVAQPTIIDQSNIEKLVKVGTDPTPVPKTVKIVPPTPTQQEDITVKNLARIFVERYHTYSSENNYQNIKDIQSIVTKSYWNKISAPLSSKIQPTSFVALTTEVVSILAVDVGRDSATVAVQVRKTTTANGTTSSGVGENTVSLVKADGKWYVSGETTK